MKDIFKLYINGKLIDFELEPTFPVTYQQEDFSNPTIIKNSFSKTIKIDGTDNNNRIFGEIYNLDREQLYQFNTYDGAYFNPSKRTPFELYKNAELLESGYMQLTDISIKDKKITYNITLYGGLGDFFYSLMYNEDGEKRTLADLWYKLDADKETELDFNINKDFVKASWDKLANGAQGATINDLIAFAPAYNGLYSDFSNNTFCVNTYNSELFNTDNSITDNNVQYTTYEGYKLAKTSKDFTEWEVRDLRSYMQRPAIKVSKLLDAIFDEDNNGGYKVKKDDKFFNSNNPYYNSAYMALPLLPSIIEGTEDTEKSYQLYLDTNYYNNYAHIGYYNNTLMLQTGYRLAFNGNDISATSANDFKIDMSNVPITSTFDVKLDFDLDFVAESLNNTMNNDYLYLSYFRRNIAWDNNTDTIVRTEYLPVYKSIIVQAYMYDAENPSSPQYYSNVLNFTSPVTYEGKTYTSTKDKWLNYTDLQKDKYVYTNVFGKFVRQGSTKNYKWVANDGSSKFYLDIKDIPRKNNMAISLKIQLVYSEFWQNVTPLIPINKQIFETVNGYTDWNINVPFSYIPYCVKGYSTLPLYQSSALVLHTNTPTVRSGSLIRKNILLKTEYSPCDVLLDYCKLFGLYFTKDIHSKTINILTKNSFFTGNVIDMNDRIDLSQEMKIKPYLFETKYYLMKNDENDSYYSKKYKNEYNLVYGQKRIDTNYNFNKDTKEVYEGSLFQNAISVTDTSSLYKTFKNSNNLLCPGWLTDSPTFELYNVTNNETKTYEKEYSYNHWIDYNNTVDWNVKSGYDIFPKTCFYNLDNNSKSLSDISSTLLFFNGFENTVDVNSTAVPFWLSDDVYTMAILNNNQMCYLYTESERDLYGSKIAYKYTSLPQFLRYTSNGNNITDSFDFGLPKEIYIPNVNYTEEATLYNKFWKNYLTDRYNVNTKKVSCFVNLNGMKINQESMRDFYYFNNCIWVANKIENYYPNSYKTTKVEFVKVNDMDNYLNAQYQYKYDTITLSESEATVEWYKTNYFVDVTSTSNWTTPRLIVGNSITPASGTQGTTNVELVTSVNTDEYLKTTTYSFTDEFGNTAKFKLTQLPSPEKAKLMYGYIYNKDTQKPLTNILVTFRDDAFDNYTREIELEPNADGYYEVWLPKTLCDSTGWIYIVIIDTTTGDEIYTNFIDWQYLEYKQKEDYAITL